jgi:hypothetical protein
MRVPVSVFVAQSVLVGALGILIVILYRQLAFLLRGVDRIDNQASGGLPVGTLAPQFDYENLRSGVRLATTFADERWTLLMFLDPLCVTCEQALKALEAMTNPTLPTFRILVVSSAAPNVVSAVHAFASTSLALGHVSAEVTKHLYRVESTPFLYVIGPTGVIRAKGAAANESSIYQLVDAAARTGTTRPATADVEFVSVGGLRNERTH